MKNNEKNNQTSNPYDKVYTVGKKETPECTRRTKLRNYILKGGAPKNFSIDQGLHETTAGKMLEKMGIRKRFITDEEHAHLMARRAGGAK
jgi:hypothetical protein